MRIAVAIALALMVAGAWWAVRGPMIGKPVADSQDIGLNATLARDGVRSPSAMGVNAPGKAVVAAMASSAPDSAAASSDDEGCGFRDAPKTAPAEIRDGLIVADQTKAAGPAWVTTQARIDAALRASPDPFDHAVADLVNVGDMRTPAGKLDALVQAATASSDARIYSMALRACYSAGHLSPIFKKPVPPASCASLTARHWASLDPGNGVAWLAVLAQADEAGDLLAQQDAIAQLVASTRFDDHQWEAAAAVLAHAPEEGANDLATHDLATTAWSSLAQFGLGPLTALCQAHAGGDAALAGQCATIATTMFDHSDSWGLRFMGASLTVYLTGDETRRKAARTERAALDVQAFRTIPTSACGILRAQMQQTLRNGQIGELAAARERADAGDKR